MKDERMIFAENLNYYMAINAKTQADIIADLDINKSTISTWCKGLKMPRMGTIQGLANYFGIRKSDLIEEKPVNERMTPKKAKLIAEVATFDDDKVEWLLEAIRLFRKEG